MLQFSQFKKTVAVAAATDIARLKQMIPAYPVPIKTKRSVRINKEPLMALAVSFGREIRMTTVR